jgi:hypothetical protein
LAFVEAHGEGMAKPDKTWSFELGLTENQSWKKICIRKLAATTVISSNWPGASISLAYAVRTIDSLPLHLSTLNPMNI